MTKRILITGGNGYVGREATRMLYDEHHVCVLDNLRTGRYRFTTHELGRFRFERADLCDRQAVARVMAEFAPDAIIHLAAIHYIPECEEDPELALSTNVNGTLNLLRASPDNARFVFASSGAVYAPDDAPHLEGTAKIGPSDVYGFTKLHGEHYTSYYVRQRGLSGVIVRLFNVIGPGETNPHLLPEIIAQLKGGRKTIRLGNMWPKRDYIHVLDAARGFAAAALAENVRPGDPVTVNLGTSKSYSVSEIVRKLQQLVPAGFAVEEDTTRQRKIDRPHLAADIEKMATHFGWRPSRSIDMALADLWREPDLTPELTAKYR
jgi:UDP-glucose 4-epimerase